MNDILIHIYCLINMNHPKNIQEYVANHVKVEFSQALKSFFK